MDSRMLLGTVWRVYIVASALEGGRNYKLLLSTHPVSRLPSYLVSFDLILIFDHSTSLVSSRSTALTPRHIWENDICDFFHGNTPREKYLRNDEYFAVLAHRIALSVVSCIVRLDFNIRSQHFSFPHAGTIALFKVYLWENSICKFFDGIKRKISKEWKTFVRWQVLYITYVHKCT